MTVIPRRRTLAGALALLAALTVTSCSDLADELDREANPERRPTPTAADLSVVPVPGPDPTPSTLEPACSKDGLMATAGRTDAAMGLRAMSITLTNCGKKPYAVKGYPAVRVLNGSRGNVDGVKVLKGPDAITTAVSDPAPRAITLKPGESATTALVWRNTVTDVTKPAPVGTYVDLSPEPGRPALLVQPVDGKIDIGTSGELGTTVWQKPDPQAN
ncbi:DUF4232 domain-containing protein [Streptomyces sp. T-3]|nr:DUF4232 domain-containing protein [Streptomyces sp. T-3]